MVTCDMTGRIVGFQIQEGKGALKEYIVDLKKEWIDELKECPIMVFDREGNGAPFFSNLIDNGIPFVTWEKNIDKKKLQELNEDNFHESFEMNQKEYSIFEGKKEFKLNQNGETKIFTLRKIYLWNKVSCINITST